MLLQLFLRLFLFYTLFTIPFFLKTDAFTIAYDMGDMNGGLRNYALIDYHGLTFGLCTL